jgi:hypothetical protein
LSAPEPSAAELVRRWRTRRLQILKTLPPELLAEYVKLGKLIKGVRLEQIQIEKEANGGVIDLSLATFSLPEGVTGTLTDPDTGASVRIPLALRRKQLAEFLKKNGPSTRNEISKGIAIPEGSLSILLSQSEFEQKSRGVWGLKGGEETRRSYFNLPPRNEADPKE